MTILQAVTDCWRESLEDDGTVVVFCVAYGPEVSRLDGRSAREVDVTRVLDGHPKPDLRKSTKPQLVFFYSKASGRCRRVEAFLAQVLQARRNHNTFVLHRVEADQRPELIRRFAVEQLPTIIVIDGKRVRGRLEQPHGCAEIQLLLAPWLR